MQKYQALMELVKIKNDIERLPAFETKAKMLNQIAMSIEFIQVKANFDDDFGYRVQAARDMYNWAKGKEYGNE